MNQNYIDYRSDTVTRPTPEMRKAMYEAEVGDDVLQEDPTMNRLEQLGAEVIGKEASLFVPSGTFGNQTAIFTHCKAGDEVVLSEKTHVVQAEVGASALIAGVQLRTFESERAYPQWKEIDQRLRKQENIHYPDTGLISLENALGGGEVMPLEDMAEIHSEASRYNVPVHLDGARIFNAAEYLKVEASRIAGYTSSIMFCLSKGLCSPVGSLLAGSKEFILKARKRRKVMGGGMRQAGILAAAGIISLEKMRLRVGEDRENARFLAAEMRKTGVFEMLPDEVQINMFFIRFKDGDFLGMEDLFAAVLKEHGIITYARLGGWMRFVTHNDISSEQVQYTASCLPEVLEKVRERSGKAMTAGNVTGNAYR